MFIGEYITFSYSLNLIILNIILILAEFTIIFPYLILFKINNDKHNIKFNLSRGI